MTSQENTCLFEGSPFLPDQSPYAELAAQYMQALLQGDRQQAGRLVRERVEQGAAVRDLYLHVFQPVLYEIGRLWQCNEISVAEEHFFTAATQLVMSQLYPYIFSTTRANQSMIAACVGDELHEVGVRMVADFFEMEGWDTWYLGANAPATSVLQAIRERRPDVLALSATMSYHVSDVRDIITQVRRFPEGKRMAVLVGGWCFRTNPDLWRQIGADGYATDAGGAVAAAVQALSLRRSPE